MKVDEYKSEAYSSIDMKLLTLNLIKSPEKYAHASQCTKHPSLTTLEGDTLLKIQKLWYAIIYAF